MSAALAQAPKMIGKVALKPCRALLLSTRMLVGPGVMEATKANSKKGNSEGEVDGMTKDSGSDLKCRSSQVLFQASGRFEQRLRYNAGVKP